ncbi:hypothetical protein SS50377_22433 [Spironucleus salmonicida]|uniref:TRAF-type domain-containing protein n=1 Tax=Spironucleus salmonicida TaxID=348837 RepID=V6LEF4_9EUKA|nr:hypothetical protein SS50377_22433 [Spironucleus salmonicida]|eukprot:EST42076.1 hypothetical protein SS50377_18383 [Spironucleus salmonicida]
MYPMVKETISNTNSNLQCSKCTNSAFTGQKIQPCNCQLCDYCAQLCGSSCCVCNSPVIDIKQDDLLQSQLKTSKYRCFCDAIVSYNDLLSHSKSCKQAKLCCPNDCGKFVANMDIYEHLQKFCNKRLVSCEFCGIILEASAMQDHFQFCGRFLIPCVNGCSVSIPRGDMILHLERCSYAEEECEFCQEKYPKSLANEHFADLNLLGKHLLGINKTYIAANNQVEKVYQDLNVRLTRIEQQLGVVQKLGSQNGSTDPSLETSSTKFMPRTSLRVIPGGQTIGNERTSASLVLPLEFCVNNIYEVVTAPPVEGAFLEVRNLLTTQIEKIPSKQTRTSIFFNLSFNETGPFELILRSREGVELDQADIDVLNQQFETTNINNIGTCQNHRASHSWINQEPSRFFLKLSEGIQIFQFKLVRANTRFSVGFSQTNSRVLKSVNSVFSKGCFVNGKYEPLQHLSFKAGDLIVLRLEGQIASLTQSGKQVYLFEDIEFQYLFIELVDAEVLLI